MKFHADARVGYGFLTAFIVLLALGVYSYRNNNELTNTNRWIVHTAEVLYFLEQTQSNAHRLEQIVAKYIITGDTSFVQRFKIELGKAAKNYARLRELTEDNPEQRARVDSLRFLGREKITILQKMIITRAHSKPEAEHLIGSTKNSDINTKTYSVIDLIRQSENGLLESRLEKSRIDLAKFRITFLTLMAMVLVVLVIVFIVIDRSFKARSQAEQKTKLINQELDAFTYSVSHDLRAPLRSVRGFAEVLKDEYASRLDEEGNRLIGIIIRNAGQMGQLIDDLLDFSRVGKKEIKISTINSQILVTEVVEELKARESNRDISFIINALPEVPGDLNLIKQVWINLIGNAIKYTRKQPQSKIEIGSIDQEGSATFFVRDNGVGFDMKYQDKLFKVFQRLHNGNTFEGTGVGLALVHRIVSRHHGKIWAEAEVNKGATFYFQLKSS